MITSLEAAENSVRSRLQQLELHALEEKENVHAELSTAVHEYCRVAQASGLTPERVIRQLKTIIADHYGTLLVRPQLVMAKDLVWHAVRRCVHAYYEHVVPSDEA